MQDESDPAQIMASINQHRSLAEAYRKTAAMHRAEAEKHELNAQIHEDDAQVLERIIATIRPPQAENA